MTNVFNLTVIGFVEPKSVQNTSERLTFSLSNYDNSLSIPENLREQILFDLSSKPVLKGFFKGFVNETFDTFNKVTHRNRELVVTEYSSI